MDGTPIISSGADLAALAPANLFDGIENIPVPSSEGEPLEAAPIEDSPEIDTGAGAAPAEDAPAPVPEEAPEPEAVPEPPKVDAKADAPEDELPEGVKKGKDRNGKQGYFLEENRYQTFHNNHKLVQQASEMIGEPVTAEALQLRNEAYLAQERLFGDLTSGDPGAQGAVIDHIFGEMARAQEQGEIGIDPKVSFSEAVYGKLTARGKDGNYLYPDAAARIRIAPARDLIGEMFELAAAKGDVALARSARHFARALAGFGHDNMDKPETLASIRAATSRMNVPFYLDEELAGMARGADPRSADQARIAELEAQLNGRTTTNHAAQFDEWQNGTTAAIKTALLDEAVKPALASVEAGWKEFPADYERLVVDPLNREVAKVIRADKGFKEKIDRLQAQAQRATSAQWRDEIRQQIKTAYVNRAKLAADAVKKPILEFAANRLKEQADQTHQRRQDAQNRTAPRGQGSAVPRSILPGNIPAFKDGVFDSNIAVQRLAALVG